MLLRSIGFPRLAGGHHGRIRMTGIGSNQINWFGNEQLGECCIHPRSVIFEDIPLYVDRIPYEQFRERGRIAKVGQERTPGSAVGILPDEPRIAR